jgi:hypothetical protein
VDEQNRISRRRMLKTVAGGTALAWSTPAIVSVAAGAVAGTPLACMHSTSMSGAQEVPPTSEDGTGTAVITISGSEVCWEIDVENVEAPVAAHIHEAPAGSNGPIVVDLSPPLTPVACGSSVCLHSEGCTEVDSDLAAAICTNPAGFYVNVHNAQFPGGAVRGQLA